MTVIPFPLHLSAFNRSRQPDDGPCHFGALEGAFTGDTLKFFRDFHERNQAVGAANADRTILFRLDAANVEAGIIHDKSKSLLGHAVAVLHRSHDGGSECAKRVSETQKLSP